MNEDRKKKAEKAAAALRAVGIDSAGAEHQSVCVSPEDAMKLLLITETDVGRVIKGEQKIRLGVKREVADIKGRLARLEKLASHSPALCKKGEHILESHATGGRSGHVSTNCLACDYHADGYD